MSNFSVKVNRARQPFNERSRNQTLVVAPNTQNVLFPGENDIYVEFTWQADKVVKAEILNSEMDYLGDWLGKVEVE
jgi:hypothetical protein